MLIVKSAYFFNLSYPQMNDFGDLLGTLYAPVSKIAPVKCKTFRIPYQTKNDETTVFDGETEVLYFLFVRSKVMFLSNIFSYRT